MKEKGTVASSSLLFFFELYFLFWAFRLIFLGSFMLAVFEVERVGRNLIVKCASFV